MAETFAQFFRSATGRDPYPFQERFATDPELPHLLRAPTGSGKTATAVLGWLYRWHTQTPGTPRRLVYCLPMRVLVEQSEREAKRWIDNLVQSKSLPETVGVHVLMGGVDTAEWFLHPEKPAVLIGTQDMLLSRALNRGYAASRFHWPIDFGLLNNDCLWVFDEPQLMGSGVSTSAQLAGLRKTLGTFGPCPALWMSATLEPGWLDTIDFRTKFTTPPHELNDADYDPARPLHKRMTAAKTLTPLGATLTKEADEKDLKAVATKVLERHEAGTQTLVVMNTVRRATRLYDALAGLVKKATTPRLLLVHSRFRPHERTRLNAQLQESGDAAKDRIIVATQVVEAGVDISARTLVTELAPWASIVQRIGRCNRTGDDGPGRVFWIDTAARDPDKKEDRSAALPYSVADLVFAREHLNQLDGQSVSPKALDDYKKENEKPDRPFLTFEHTHVLRRRDLLDLFDTAPDLSGNDIDVSRFVRGDDPETDVQVFWRAWNGDAELKDQPSPGRRELCPVPVGQVREFLASLADKKRGTGYVWNHLESEWVKLDPRLVRPGLTILFPASAGGYSDIGWDPSSTVPVTPFSPAEKVPEESADSDQNSATPVALTVADHTRNVCKELERLLSTLGPLPDGWAEHLRVAARWHDIGKAHEAFQTGVRSVNSQLDANQHWAKSGKTGRLRHGRTHFRHELASALAALQNGVAFEPAYLIGGHHGHVRLGIRALPGEEPPDERRADRVRTEWQRDPYSALGVWDMDEFGPVDLGDGEPRPKVLIDLTPMRLGGSGSWTARALALVSQLGPFRLAYLEAVLRAADVRASRKEAGRDC